MKKFLATLLIAATVTTGAGFIYPNEVHAAPEATVINGVNFRSAPNVNAGTFRTLKTGEKIQVISKVNDYWYWVQTTQGQLGYISTNSKYIRFNSNGGSSGSGGGGSNTSSTRNNIINAGKKYLGTPYEFGSDRSNTRTFDCSDFVRQAFKEGAGITLPSDSRSQGNYVKEIGRTTTNWRNLQPGDVMFFMSYKGTSKSSYPSNTSNQRITHNGIYLGDGKVLHTYSKEAGGVRIDNIAGEHWEYRLIFGGSALR